MTLLVVWFMVKCFGCYVRGCGVVMFVGIMCDASCDENVLVGASQSGIW